MNETKELDLGGVLNANDLDRTFDNSVVIIVPFSIKRDEDMSKAEAIKGSLRFIMKDVSLRDELKIACEGKHKVSWASTRRTGKHWIGVPPKQGETIDVPVATYFNPRGKATPLTAENLLAQFGGDLEAVKAALDAAAEANHKAEEEKGIVHIDPEIAAKDQAEKDARYLADEEETKIALKEGLKRDKAAADKEAKRKKDKAAKKKE